MTTSNGTRAERAQNALQSYVEAKGEVFENSGSEMGDLIGAAALGGEKLFSYVRYDAALNAATLASLGFGHIRAAQLQGMDSIGALAPLKQVGIAIAESQVHPGHLAGF